MRKRKTIEVLATYCDYCGKELDGNHASTITKTCLDKYKELSDVERRENF